MIVFAAIGEGNAGLTRLIIILVYLSLLLLLGFFASRLFRGTKKDYMLASSSIGPFLLLMSIFGTTMTAFALVGSSGESWKDGIGVYGKLASSSGIIHSLCFFLIGVKLWTLGQKYGYTTQIQYFRDRLNNNAIGLILFPILVGLIIPYLLIGVMAGGTVMNQMTDGAFGKKKGGPPPAIQGLSENAPKMVSIYKDILSSMEKDDSAEIDAKLKAASAQFVELHGGKKPKPPTPQNALPKWMGSLLICGVVLIYVFFGGMRGTAWANAFQTIVFMVLGLVTFCYLGYALGGQEGKGLVENLKAATAKVTPENKVQSQIEQWEKISNLSKNEKTAVAAGLSARRAAPPKELKEYTTRKEMSFLVFVTYMFVPLSVGMFPHLFQHWLTARDAKSFKTPVICHPIFIMIVWVPCVLIGIWGTTTTFSGTPNAILIFLVKTKTGAVLGGFLAAGILAAIMSSLDSQFLCIGTMFTTDIVNHYYPKRYTDRQQILVARLFIIAIVIVTYLLSLGNLTSVFALGVWCFSGFSALFPLVVACLYWKRLTVQGAYSCVIAAAVTWVYFFTQAYQSDNFRTYTVDIGEYQTMPVFWMILASTIAMMTVSFATPPMNEGHLHRFFPESKNKG
ncbi:sodium:solute symporter family protein [Mariniblastus sp.]|jgi:SSS family solute:Na+ symporter|nr:sodium:solute symporter family protein [Mariniblastus sp.]MDB4756116.1 sodium:solute symporter family protein [Mariniblastus sp.]